jgi:hypothetical protein
MPLAASFTGGFIPEDEFVSELLIDPMRTRYCEGRDHNDAILMGFSPLRRRDSLDHTIHSGRVHAKTVTVVREPADRNSIKPARLKARASTEEVIKELAVEINTNSDSWPYEVRVISGVDGAVSLVSLFDDETKAARARSREIYEPDPEIEHLMTTNGGMPEGVSWWEERELKEPDPDLLMPGSGYCVRGMIAA